MLQDDLQALFSNQLSRIVLDGKLPRASLAPWHEYEFSFLTALSLITPLIVTCETGDSLPKRTLMKASSISEALRTLVDARQPVFIWGVQPLLVLP